MIQKTRELYGKYKAWTPIAFFILGFAFDAAVLHRIDETSVIIQQAIYILLSASLISIELVELSREIEPPYVFAKVWKYREAILHFLLGTLLNSYTIFYFKSTSALTSFIFILVLVVILILNEFKKFGKSQTQVHVALLSLCLISYLASLVPILVGFIGHLAFALAFLASLGIFAGFYFLMKKRFQLSVEVIKLNLIYPFAAMQIFFATLYVGQVIPPVPLSVTYMGIYHLAEKSNGEYRLSTTRPRWKFWQHGDQSFLSRSGDKIYCFIQIYSPSRFKENLQIRWLQKDEKLGWQSADAIPIASSGGREEGFRLITKKENYQPGLWRVQVETKYGQEIGRIDFTVTADTDSDLRTFTVENR